MSVFADSVSSGLRGLLDSAPDHRVKKHINRALQFDEKGFNRALREELELLARLDPDSADEYRRLIECAGKEAATPQPEAAAESSGEAAPKPAKSPGAGAFTEKKYETAYKYYTASRTDDALRVLAEILTIDSGHEGALSFISLIESEKFIFDSTKPFQNIVREFYGQGMGFYRREMYKEAEERFRKAAETDPTNKQVAEYIGKTADKLAALSEKAARDRELNRADRARTGGDIKTARAIYEKVLKSEPDNSRAAFYLADFERQAAALIERSEEMLKANNPEGAKEAADRAYQYSPKASGGAKKRADFEYASSRDAEKRKREADRLYNRGVTAFAKGDYRLAAECWQAVLKINPDDAEAAKNARLASERLAATGEEGQRNVKNALDEADDFKSQGLIEQAKSRYEYVLRIEPGNKEAAAGLAEIKKIGEQGADEAITKRQ